MGGSDEASFTNDEKAEIFNGLKALAIGMAEVRKDVQHVLSNLPKQPCPYFEALQKRVEVLEAAQRQAQNDWRKALLDFGGKAAWLILTAAAIIIYAKSKGVF